MTSVYLHTFPDGKVYVGIADNPTQRWKGGAGYVGNAKMYEAIMQHGWANISHTIVAECETRQEAEKLEREYILLYDSENPGKGYNRTDIKADLIAKVQSRNQVYEGFGERHSAAGWAKILGIHRSTFSRYMKQGLTVEEVFTARSVLYIGADQVERKPRVSKAMRETQETIYTLLLSSGYIPEEGLDSVEVRPTSNQQHLVAFEGSPLGVYNYKTGVLKLSRKTGIPLKSAGLENPLIKRNWLGLWEPHPETMAELFNQHHKKAE